MIFVRNWDNNSSEHRRKSCDYADFLKKNLIGKLRKILETFEIGVRA